MDKKDPSRKTLEESYSSWKSKSYEKPLEENSNNTTSRTTVSGKEIKELYTPLDLDGFDYQENLGFP